MEEDKLLEAVERIRRDQYHPWRYLFFTLLNGIAQGLGMALGMTIVLGLVIYLLVKILTQMINFPVVGMYIDEILKFVNQYIQQGVPRR